MLTLCLFAPHTSLVSARADGWWDASYDHRQFLHVGAMDAIPSGYSLKLTFDHAALVSQGHARADGQDTRVAFYNGTSWIELDRLLDPKSSWNQGNTQIWFKTQAAIAAHTSVTTYSLYYGNPSASGPPANGNNIFTLFDDFSSGAIDSAKWETDASTGADVQITNGQLQISGTSSIWTSPVWGYNGISSTSRTFGDTGYAYESTLHIVHQDAAIARKFKATLGAEEDWFALKGMNNEPNDAWIAYFDRGALTWRTLGESTLRGEALPPIRIMQTTDSSGRMQHFENGVLKASRFNVTNSTVFSQAIFAYGPEVEGIGAFDVRFDDIWVRKHVANEPVVTLLASNNTTLSAEVPQLFSFTVTGKTGTCNGETLSTGTSTATSLDFASVTSSTNQTLAQELTVETNSPSGYSTYISGHNPTIGLFTIPSLPTTNAAPDSFPAAGTAGIGYTTSDSNLGLGTPDRFTNGGAKWAGYSVANEEVSHSPVPAPKTICVAHQVGISTSTPAGTYLGSVRYLAVPTF